MPGGDCGCVNARDRFTAAGRRRVEFRVPTEGNTDCLWKPQARRSLLMTRQIHRIAALATAGLAVAGLAACSSSNSGGTGGGNNANKPVFGGTLRIVAASGPDHLDPVPAYYTADYILEKAYTPHLMPYPTTPPPPFTSPPSQHDIPPVPDTA